jgi:hypothetical protein
VTPEIVRRHLRGDYSIAVVSPGWVDFATLDLDAHKRPGESETAAQHRALGMARGVWRALGCTAAAHPITMRSPGAGYHLYLPLSRGAASPAEHTWPSLMVRGWFEHVLRKRGLPVQDGDIEVYPSGRALRAPCGLGTQLLQPINADDPDRLTFRPWPGTLDHRFDTRQLEWDRNADIFKPVRRPLAMLRVFLDEWERCRRPLDQWLAEPEAAWDSEWGPLLWRSEREWAPALFEKWGAECPATPTGSQEVDEGSPEAPGHSAEGRGRAGGAGQPKRSPSSPKEIQTLTPPNDDTPSAPASEKVLRGRAFLGEVARLLLQGIVAPSTRHSGVLRLSFYWGATCGLSDREVLGRLEDWCGAHAHDGSRHADKPADFLKESLREARHYLINHGPRWPFRGSGGHGGMGVLRPEDALLVFAADPRLRSEVTMILAWLAGRADRDGRIGEPVQIATGLLKRLCADRRLTVDDKRRRTTTMAIEELERLGVLTLAANYRVGKRGRMFSCWYQFGSGVVARGAEVPRAEWEQLGAREVSVVFPKLSVAPKEAQEPDGVVSVRVVAERSLPDGLGLLRVLSSGGRGRARSMLVADPEQAQPSVSWYGRPFQRTLTVGEVWDPALGLGTMFPSGQMRQKLTRSKLLLLGGGRLAALEPKKHSPAASDLERSERSTAAADLSVRALEAEIVPIERPKLDREANAREALERAGGSITSELSGEAVEVVDHAAQAFRERNGDKE